VASAALGEGPAILLIGQAMRQRKPEPTPRQVSASALELPHITR
jgi:hypothetical protein